MMIEIENKFDFLEKYYSKGVELRCDEDGYLFENKNKAKIWIDDKKFLEVEKIGDKIKIKSKKKDFLISLNIISLFKIYSDNLDIWINNNKIEKIKLNVEVIEKILEKSENVNIFEIKLEEYYEEEMMVWIIRPEFEDEYLRMLNEKSSK